MGKIDTSEWKEFSVCELFGKSKLGKYHSPESLVESETGYPYICASNQNNGVNQKMSLVSGDDVRPTPQNIISWGKQCPYFTFHEEPCVTGQGMYYIVVPKYIPRRAIRYVITVLQSAVEGKFGYSDCFIGSSMDDLSIKLPSTLDGAPDWAYMESYMANIETKVTKSLTLLQAAKDAEKKKVDTREWGEFRVGELFDIKRPAARSEKKYCEGEINYVSSGAFNNGVANKLMPLPNELLDRGGCITVSPLDGSSFYQEEDFLGRGGSGASISILYNSHLNRNNALFICSVIRSSANGFGYTDLLNGENLKSLTIKLPMDKTGQPDWAYMEEYMKMMQEKTENVLNQFISA